MIKEETKENNQVNGLVKQWKAFKFKDSPNKSNNISKRQALFPGLRFNIKGEKVKSIKVYLIKTHSSSN